MEFFYILLVLLIASRIFAEIAVRFGQPELFGEILAGILLGLVVHEFTDTFPILSELDSNKIFTSVKDLGIFFLLLMGGIELRPRDMVRASQGGILISVGGMVVPFLFAVLIGMIYLPESSYRTAQIIFLGTALSVTAVPVAIKVLMDMNLLDSKMGKMIVSAAVIDDALSLILLAVLTAVIKSGSIPGGMQLAHLVFNVILFFAVTSLIGYYLFPAAGKLFQKTKADEFELSMLLISAFSYAVLAELLGMHFILGAFQAGLFFSRKQTTKETYEDIQTKIQGVTNGFLAPVFFASVGLHLDVSALIVIPGFVLLLILTATMGKLLGAGLAARLTGMNSRESTAIGMAMNARGAVELVIADIALRAGVFSAPDPAPPVVAQLFSAVVIMAVTTTLLTPLSLRFLMKRSGSS